MGRVGRALEVSIKALNGDLNTMRNARKPRRGMVWFMIYEGKDNSVSAQVSGSKNGGEPDCRIFREGAGSPEYSGFREVGRFQMHFRRFFNGNRWVEYGRKRKEEYRRNLRYVAGLHGRDAIYKDRGNLGCL